MRFGGEGDVKSESAHFIQLVEPYSLLLKIDVKAKMGKTNNFHYYPERMNE